MKDRIPRYLAWIIFFFNLLDGIFTYVWITRFGVAEANPLSAWFMEAFSLPAWLIVKMSFGFVLSLLILDFWDTMPKSLRISSWSVAAIYVGVIIWHLIAVFYLLFFSVV